MIKIHCCTIVVNNLGNLKRKVSGVHLEIKADFQSLIVEQRSLHKVEEEQRSVT